MSSAVGETPCADHKIVRIQEHAADGRTMNLDDFYGANPDRRDSDELEFGAEWTDGSGTLHEVAWIQRTGEVYAMSERDIPTVEVLGVVSDRVEIEHLLAGWPEAIRGPDGLAWVRDRIAGRTHAPDGSARSAPSHELDRSDVLDVPYDRRYRLKFTLALGSATALGAAIVAELGSLRYPDRPLNPVDAMIAAFIGTALYVNLTPRGRAMSDNSQRQRAVKRAVGREGRGECSRALREGRAVRDPRLARYAIRSAERSRALLTSNMSVWPSIVFALLAAISFADGRIIAGLIGLALAAMPWILLRALRSRRARRLQLIEASIAANERLLPT